MAIYRNPVIKGYNADPSICRVGEDYYLVTSTGEFFPGIPIYHSRDLVHWTMVGHCLTRDSQVNLENSNGTGGIYAATLRYHNGQFYTISTNTTNNGNFLVHAPSIEGPWSEPVWVDEGGIDPSLLFDDDGKVYYCSTHHDSRGIQCTIAFELDPYTGQAVSERHIINYGTGGKYPEGPHLYHIGKWYYLIQAEGGTEYGHMVTIFRSSQIFGPYESCPRNPVLTHRDNQYSSIQAVGHADLVDDPSGNWWLLCHGIRQIDARLLHNLGRETYLVPVHWDEEGWPVCGRNGHISYQMEAHIPGTDPNENIIPDDTDFFDSFTSPTWPSQWTFVHNPDLSKYCRGDGLTIHADTHTLNDETPFFLGIRQPEHQICAKVLLSSKIEEGQTAGLTAYYNRFNHYEGCLTRENGRLYAFLSKHLYDMETQSERIELPEDEYICLLIYTDVEDYRFECQTSNGTFLLGTGKTAGLCTESQMIMCFSGTFIGLFSSNGTAHFRDFTLFK